MPHNGSGKTRIEALLMDVIAKHRKHCETIDQAQQLLRELTGCKDAN